MKELEALEDERRRKEAERGVRPGEKLRAVGKKKERPNHPEPKGVASNEMCTFLVVNISSLQLIPVNMIAYRAQYGSANPMAVVGPALLATSVSTLVGILFCKVMERGR